MFLRTFRTSSIAKNSSVTRLRYGGKSRDAHMDGMRGTPRPYSNDARVLRTRLSTFYFVLFVKFYFIPFLTNAVVNQSVRSYCPVVDPTETELIRFDL